MNPEELLVMGELNVAIILNHINGFPVVTRTRIIKKQEK